MNKQQLANRIWASADNLRGKIEASEYKDYILGLIFYKFLSDTEVKFLKERGWKEEDLPELVKDDEDPNMRNTIEECQDQIGFFIEYKYLFSTWLNNADFTVQTLREALKSFNDMMSRKYASVYDGIFKTLSGGLSNLGENPSAQTKALRELLDKIKDIPTDGSQDYDVLGYIYEYLLSNFAANAGKKAGEFYTPHEVAMVMSEIVADHHKNKESLEIYDPTSGSGSLLITIGKAVSKHIQGENKVKYYAQEVKDNTYNLTRMNLVMRGIIPQNIVTRCADTLEEDWPIHDEGSEIDKPLAVDAVVSNPPYSLPWHPEKWEHDPRFINYGVAPKTKADYAFLLHELHHLKPDGILTIVLPHGVLFRGQAEGEIRANLIEKNNIDAIIGLPANIFFGTGIPTIIMVLKKNRGNEGVLIIDASKGFVKDGKKNRLRACDIKKIADTYRERKSIPRYSREVTRDEIRQNEYNLNIPRYVDSSEATVKYDIYSTMFGSIPNSEIADLQEYWNTFPTLQQEIFAGEQNRPYSTIKVTDLVATINGNADVKDFKVRFTTAFKDFKRMLHIRLIDNVEQVKDVVESDIISADIFRRCEGIPLVDKYDAYQIFASHWADIIGDVEIIQSEGFGACNQLTEDYKEGRIIPFNLVQVTLLPDELAALNRLRQKKEEIDNQLTELLEDLDADEQDLLLNDDNTDFDRKKVNEEWNQILEGITTHETELLEAYLSLSKKSEKLAYVEKNPADCWAEIEREQNGTFAKNTVKAAIVRLKSACDFEEDTTEAKVKSIVLALDKISELGREIKAAESLLKQHTVETIQNLDMKQIAQLLELKWIQPITSAIEALPDAVIKALADAITALTEKYSVTYDEIETGIAESEKNLAELIGQLTGDRFAISGLNEMIK